MGEIEIMDIFSQWREIRINYEKYVSDLRSGVYGKDASEQMISVDEFQKAV